MLFSVVSYFFITIIALGLLTGDRPHEPARGACASAEAVTSYFLSYIFFYSVRVIYYLILMNFSIMRYLIIIKFERKILILRILFIRFIILFFGSFFI